MQMLNDWSLQLQNVSSAFHTIFVHWKRCDIESGPLIGITYFKVHMHGPLSGPRHLLHPKRVMSSTHTNGPFSNTNNILSFSRKYYIQVRVYLKLRQMQKAKPNSLFQIGKSLFINFTNPNLSGIFSIFDSPKCEDNTRWGHTHCLKSDQLHESWLVGLYINEVKRIGEITFVHSTMYFYFVAVFLPLTFLIFRSNIWGNSTMCSKYIYIWDTSASAADSVTNATRVYSQWWYICTGVLFPQWSWF